LKTLSSFFCFYKMIRCFLSLILLFLAFTVHSQEIHFTPLESGNERGMTYDIIGRAGRNLMIYRSFKNDHSISLYNDSMQPVRKIDLTFLPRQLVKVDFINTNEVVYLFYQFVQKDILFCNMAIFNTEARLISEPAIVDSLILDDPRKMKVFNFIANAAKSHIMTYSKTVENEQVVKIKTSLYDKKMSLVDKTDMLIVSPNGADMLREFQLDNNGNLIFFRGVLNEESGILTRADVLIKPFSQDTVKFTTIRVNDLAVREMRLQTDNTNNTVIAAALFGSGSRIDIAGVFTLTIDILNNNILAGNPLFFSDSLREESKLPTISKRSTFNDYVIDEIIPYKNGGYALLIERRVAEGSRYPGAGFRFFSDNLLSPSIVLSGMSGYAPLFSTFGGPGDAFRQPIDQRSFVKNTAGNLLLVSLNPQGELTDIQMLRKEQVEENSSDLISYTTIRTSSGLRLMFNEKERGALLPNMVAYVPGNRLKRLPSFKNLVPNFRFMMRKGIQTGPAESIIPCVTSSYISFVKVKF
jgi:hypothetical protein